MAQSTAEELRQPAHGAGHGPEGDDAEHAAHPFLAHHFDTPKHQFEAGKLAIWIFLAQEVLFFSALFCAYAIYRSLHPEIFIYAHYYLDTFWGGVNTCVLIVSSLTAALAVRFAQRGEQRNLVICIVLTVLCACGFLGVKYVEYAHKFHDHILPGRHFNPTEEVWQLESYKEHQERFGHPHAGAVPPSLQPGALPSALTPVPAPAPMPGAEPAAPGGVPPAAVPPAAVPSAAVPPAAVPPAAVPPAAVPPAAPGSASGPSAAPAAPANAAPGAAPAPASVLAEVAKPAPPGALQRPRNVGVFFSIYFCMTGLHGIHVLVGIGVWLWILRRAMRGEFGPQNFGAVDYVALYWHLVDLIWIYLFPLLYLIH